MATKNEKLRTGLLLIATLVAACANYTAFLLTNSPAAAAGFAFAAATFAFVAGSYAEQLYGTTTRQRKKQ